MRARHVDNVNPGGNALIPHAPPPDPPAPPPDREAEPTNALTKHEEPDAAATDSDGSGTNSGNEASTIDPIPPDDDDEDEDEEDPDEKPQGVRQPNTQMLDKFRECCDTCPRAHMHFSRAQRTSIRPLATLKKKKAPLNAFADPLE